MKIRKRADLAPDEIEFSRVVEALTASIWDSLCEYDAAVIAAVTARLLAHFLSGWSHKTDVERLREEVLASQLELVRQILALVDEGREVH